MFLSSNSRQHIGRCSRKINCGIAYEKREGCRKQRHGPTIVFAYMPSALR